MCATVWGGVLRVSQAPRRAVCGTRGSLRTMHGGGSAPSCRLLTVVASLVAEHRLQGTRIQGSVVVALGL